MDTTASSFAELAFEALGTKCHIIFYQYGDEAISSASSIVRSEISRYDEIFSVYRHDSEITHVNISSDSRLLVSREFAELTSMYIDSYTSSGGIIDPAMGFELIDLYRRYNSRIDELSSNGFFRGVDFKEVSVDLPISSSESWISRPVGMFLDFGGLGKSYIADRIASLLAAQFSGGVLVNLGGDIATGGTVPQGGWNIKVTDDFSLDPTAPGGSICIFGGGLATSSLVTRRWSDSRGDERLHIIGEGVKSSSIATVSAVAKSAFDANFYSLGALLMGEQAVPWLIRKQVPSLVRTSDGRGFAVSGWPTNSKSSDMNLIGAS
ncbi:MAG: FAD:protein FMN transferase [Actinomycetota bacterium]|nr:FAD:protein FMN transferase [Actinomycetota bacterium]